MGISFGRIVSGIKDKVNTKLRERTAANAAQDQEDREYKQALAKARQQERMKTIPRIAKAEAGIHVSRTLKGLKSGKTENSGGFWGKVRGVSDTINAGNMAMFDGGFSPIPIKKTTGTGFMMPTMDFMGVGNPPPTPRKSKKRKR